jgi:hypothetical protein
LKTRDDDAMTTTTTTTTRRRARGARRRATMTAVRAAALTCVALARAVMANEEKRWVRCDAMRCDAMRLEKWPRGAVGGGDDETTD